MGCLNVIIDSDIIFLLVSILRPHYFNLLKTALKWRIFISQEIEEEIEDPVSSSLKEKLLKEGIWEYFSPSDHQQAKEIARKYKDLRKTIHKGEASCYAIAYCAGSLCYPMIMKQTVCSLWRSEKESNGILFTRCFIF